MSAVAQSLAPPPPPFYESSAYPLLTPTMAVLLNGFLLRLREVAWEETIPIGQIRLSGCPVSDEASARLLVTAQVALPAADALAFWDKAGASIERWASGLDAGLAVIVLDQISLDVEWREDASV